MTRGKFLARLGMIALLGAFAAFAWRSLPDAPRPERERAGHAHSVDPAWLAEGVVVAVDRAAGMVTISHGPLQNLGMPPMTMGFAVTERAALEALQPGARIKFHADVLDGAFMASKIERVAQ